MGTTPKQDDLKTLSMKYGYDQESQKILEM